MRNFQGFVKIPAVDPDFIVDRTFAFIRTGRIEIEGDPAIVTPLIEHGPNRRMVNAAGPQVYYLYQLYK